MSGQVAPLIRAIVEAVPDRPFDIEFWEGSRVPGTSAGGPCFTARSPAALAHVLRAPGQLGLGRAYVSGELEISDIDAVVGMLGSYKPPAIGMAEKARLIAAAARTMGVVRLPRRPDAELVPRGRRHSRARDARAVRHHYNVSNEFFELMLGPSLTYSCALFSRGADSLEEAQAAKHELVCSKLALRPGEQVLDVGCGWGSFALHAAEHHGARVLGITLSAPQADLARRRAREAGLEDLVRFEVADYRDLGAEQFDAISSVGMVEHVGAVQIDAYAAHLARILRPGGRLLNHGIARLRHTDSESGSFSERFVFPDAAPLHLSRVQSALERAGLETDHSEGLRSDYVETLRHWAQRLDDRLDEAIHLAGPERVRVWRLYLRASRNGFASGFMSIYQVRASVPEILRQPRPGAPAVAESAPSPLMPLEV